MVLPTSAILLAVVLTGVGLAGCAAPPLVFDQPVVMLGEVHDNATQHALRLRAFQSWLASGARPALALEQIDREHQPALDALLAQSPAPDADAVVALARGNVPQGTATGWNWALYRPYIALALQYRLPIVAANVSREDARKVMRGGLAASGFDANVPPLLLQTLAGAIQASHCGLVDAATAGRMALAQVARDQFMARVVSNAQAAGDVLLLAGNGHVRTDIGAPRWLSPALRQRSLAVGYLEAGDDSAAAYDRVVVTPRQPRNDPCAGTPQPPGPASQ